MDKKKLTRMAALAIAGLLIAMTPAVAQTGSTTGSTGDTGSSSGVSGTATGPTGGAMDPGASAMGTSGSMAQLSTADQKFVTEAAQGGMEEVELGKLAVSNAANADVKTFGQRMVDDHGKANDQLKQVAQTKGVALPTDVNKSQRKDIDKLSKLTGADFDRTYMRMMVSDHKKDVSEFKKESKSGQDTDVKSFASTTLPTLEDHLKMALDTASKVSGSNTASMSKHPTYKKPGGQ